MRRHNDLTPGQTQMVPAMESPLPKAEPIIETGGTSMITYLRKVKKHCAAAGVEGSEKTGKQELCKHQGQRRRRGRGAPGTEAKILL